MKKVFTALFFFIISTGLLGAYIEIGKEDINSINIPIDIVGYNRDANTFMLYVSDSMLPRINVPFGVCDIKSTPKGYLSSYAIIDSLISIHENYPSITKIDTIGYTYEGKPLVMIFVGKDTLNPALLLMGCHHAREWQTPGVVLFFVDSLLRSSSLPQVDSILSRVSLYAIPLVNPDGYEYSLTEDNSWRKNRRYFPEYNEYGVDLNRNYGGGCNGNVYSDWGTTINTATSHNVSTLMYCGDMPFSENETQSIRDFVILHPQIKVSLSYHSYGEEILYPWASINEETPHDDVIKYLAYQIASRIIGRNGTPYDTMRSAELYPTTGDTDDWIYGYSTYVLGRTILPFTIECDNVFQPDTSSLLSLYQSNYNGIFYALSYTESLSVENMVVIDSFYCDYEEDTIYGYFNYRNNNSLFIVREYTGYESITEGFENGLSVFLSNGFYIDSSQFYEGRYSVKERNGNFSCSYLETKLPLHSDSISFYLKYSIEDGNVLYFEVSKDGYYWYPPAKDALFTGDSNGWFKFDIGLPDSLMFIRFRFTTYTSSDDSVYIDNIYPSPYCDSIYNADIEISNNSFILLDRSNQIVGLRGYNSVGFGPWSFVYLRGNSNSWELESSLGTRWSMYLPEHSDYWEANVYDISGRKVAYYNYPYYTNKIHIDASKLPNGIYIVNVFNNNMELSHNFKCIKTGGVNEQ